MQTIPNSTCQNATSMNGRSLMPVSKSATLAIEKTSVPIKEIRSTPFQILRCVGTDRYFPWRARSHEAMYRAMTAPAMGRKL